MLYAAINFGFNLLVIIKSDSAIFFIARMITDRIGLPLVLLPKSSLKTTTSHEWFYVISSTDEGYSLHFIQQVVVWRNAVADFTCKFFLTSLFVLPDFSI